MDPTRSNQRASAQPQPDAHATSTRPTLEERLLELWQRAISGEPLDEVVNPRCQQRQSLRRSGIEESGLNLHLCGQPFGRLLWQGCSGDGKLSAALRVESLQLVLEVTARDRDLAGLPVRCYLFGAKVNEGTPRVTARIAVLGPFQAGKSCLINSLITQELTADIGPVCTEIQLLPVAWDDVSVEESASVQPAVARPAVCLAAIGAAGAKGTDETRSFDEHRSEQESWQRQAADSAAHPTQCSHDTVTQSANDTSYTSPNRPANEAAPVNPSLSAQAILGRYAQAIFRYLRAALGKDGADEAYEMLSKGFCQGEWRALSSESGRIRDTIKAAVNALIEQTRKGARAESALEADRRFVTEWRASLLAKAWEALAEEERRSGRPMHTVLHFRAGNPEMRSAQMAVELSQRLCKTLSADWVRKWLHAAREKFAEFLLLEVAASLREPTVGALTEELMDLELLQYCKLALETWKSH